MLNVQPYRCTEICTLCQKHRCVIHTSRNTSYTVNQEPNSAPTLKSPRCLKPYTGRATWFQQIQGDLCAAPALKLSAAIRCISGEAATTSPRYHPNATAGLSPFPSNRGLQVGLLGFFGHPQSIEPAPASLQPDTFWGP